MNMTVLEPQCKGVSEITRHAFLMGRIDQAIT